MREREKLILEVAKYIIENKATIKKTAEQFDKSPSSIKKYINDDDKLKSIDENVYMLVKQVQSEIEHQGQIKGAKIGKRGPSLSEEETIKIGKLMIQNGWTLKETESYSGIPASTIYERIISIKDEKLKEDLKELFELNLSSRGGKR